MKKIVAIVPSAGLSQRFGGPNKLLQPWGSRTVVGSVVGVLEGLDPIVVTGRDAEEVARAVVPARAVFNPRFEEGLGTSIAAGIAACERADGFLIALGDMPGLRRDNVDALIGRFEESGPDSIIAPVYASEPERAGHPVLFGSDYREALEALSGDQGARSILQANRQRLRLVPLNGSLPDIDRPTDL